MAKKSMIIKNSRKKDTRIQYKNRCNICGRPKGFIRFFGVCRICFRSLAGNGLLPGVTKSSW